MFFILVHKLFSFVKNKLPFGAKLILMFQKSDIYYYLSNAFYGYYNYRFAKKNEMNPTKQMLDNRIFYSLNKDRVERVSSFFADNESKETYLKMIDFRCNSVVENFPLVNRKTSYFWNNYFSYGTNEILIDCGAYIGDSIISFRKAVKHFKGKIEKIVAFEPEINNYKILCNEFKDIIAINAGVWDKDTMLTLSDNETGSQQSFIKEISEVIMGGGGRIPVKSIDNCSECQFATIIKMDIEGSELKALKGAEKTIKAYKPKLAICIYHSNEDMLQIPEWIHDNFPKYKLFVKQHAKYDITETVLYGFNYST